MKKILFFLILLICSSFLFSYELTMVSTGEANSVAQNWLIFINKIPLEGKQGKYQIDHIEQVQFNGNLLCEIYHLYPRGHIVVPSYREFIPVKSFSVSSDFNSESQGYEYAVIEELKVSFQFLQSYKQGDSERIDWALQQSWSQWNRFLQMELEGAILEELDLISEEKTKDTSKFVLKNKEGVQIQSTSASPLLDTKWSQRYPYWNDCPLSGGSRCLVGCVATAMAQIMKYYESPQRGEGSHSYNWGGETLSANFSDSYDWAHMPNRTAQYDTDVEKNAVAELCYEAGVSVEMDYGTGGSSAYISDVASALKNYFRYSSARVVWRINYGNVDRWFEVLKDQRDSGRPLGFGMYSEDSGHAVVIDGYLITEELNQVHINMGWGGSYDAYYTLDDILDFTETLWQHAVVDIVPGGGGSPDSPEIQLDTSSLSFSGTAGQDNPSSQTFEIKNSGDGELDYEISDNKNWISVSPESGSSTGEWDTITVSVNISSLSTGTYSGTIEITSGDASNSPQEVDVNLEVEGPVPKIQLNEDSLSFSGTAGQDNSSSQTFEIKNSGDGELDYEISDNKNWISVSPESGSSTGEWDTIAVSVNISSLSTGTYSGTIEIRCNDASNSPQQISVSLEVEGPEIQTNKSSLSFNGVVNQDNPSSQNFQVKNSSVGELNYQISDNKNWISISPESGSSTGEWDTITVSVNISSLSKGTYSGTIEIRCNDADNSPQQLSVNLEIEGPEIQTNKDSLSFTGEVGQDNPSSQTFQVKNSSAGELNYQISDDRNWISVSPESGSSTGEWNTITVSIDISSLSKGTYSGTVKIKCDDAGNSPQQISVNVEVKTPEIELNKDSLSFTGIKGQSNPSPQTFNIRNSSVGVLNYELSDNKDWINVSPENGSSTGEWDTITVSVNTSSLSKGTYSGTITLTGENASNSPYHLPINVEVKTPEIELNKNSLSFTGIKGHSNPSPQTFNIRNSSIGVLNYQISSNKDWISVSPQSGSSTAEWDTITVSIDISSLGKGTYTGIIQIICEDASNSPRQITINLEVDGPEIQLNKTSFSFTGVEGQSNPPSQEFKIRNSSIGVLHYQISPGENWISVSPQSGSSTDEWDTIIVSTDISSLIEGTHIGTLQITCEDAGNSPRQIIVRLTVQPPPIYAPLNFHGTKVENRSLMLREYINNLTWDANSLNMHIEKYRIYQINGQTQDLLSEQDAGVFEFWHRNVEKDRQYMYKLVAIDYKNREGAPVYLTIQ